MLHVQPFEPAPPVLRLNRPVGPFTASASSNLTAKGERDAGAIKTVTARRTRPGRRRRRAFGRCVL